MSRAGGRMFCSLCGKRIWYLREYVRWHTRRRDCKSTHILTDVASGWAACFHVCVCRLWKVPIAAGRLIYVDIDSRFDGFDPEEHKKVQLSITCIVEERTQCQAASLRAVPIFRGGVVTLGRDPGVLRMYVFRWQNCSTFYGVCIRSRSTLKGWCC